MHRHLTVASIAVALLMASAFAQNPPQGQPPGDQRAPVTESSRVNLTLEQEHVIKEIVKELKWDPEPTKVPETVGTSLPDGIKLHGMPRDIAAKVPQIKLHRLFVRGGKIFIVDPRDNAIVEVVD